MRSLVLLSVVTLLAAIATAQGTSATVTGRVLDPSGAVIVGRGLQ